MPIIDSVERTLADRERIRELETWYDDLQDALNYQIEKSDKEIKALKELVQECSEWINPRPQSALGAQAILFDKIQAALEDNNDL